MPLSFQRGTQMASQNVVARSCRLPSRSEPVKGQILAGKCQARRRGAEANYATFFPARHANGITKRRCAKLQAPVPIGTRERSNLSGEMSSAAARCRGKLCHFLSSAARKWHHKTSLREAAGSRPGAFEETPMSVAPESADQSVLAEDVQVLHQMGYAQELARGMKGFSNFAISFSIICILAGGITSFQTGYSTTGGFGIGVGWLVGGIFSLIVGFSMAQIGSAYPTAGGLYHWSSILGGRGWGWATAWMNLLGLIFVTAAVTVGAYTLFTSLILTNIFHIDTSKWGYWQQLAGVSIIAIAQGLCNHFGIKLTSKLTDISGYLIFAVAALLTATMLFSVHHFDFSRLFHIVNNTGDAGGGVVPHTNNLVYAFLLGL